MAPAKLTMSLRVKGVRPDGYHQIVAEMVALDFADELVIDPSGSGLRVVAAGPDRTTGLSTGADNLVRKALDAVHRAAHVELVKRIPVGGGLGGGSADAAAVLRWAGCQDAEVAGTIGADVPFCVSGGRAIVSGIGEQVVPLPFEPRSFVLLIPPFGMDTGAVYRAWDQLSSELGRPWHEVRNDLTKAAVTVEPRLADWRRAFAGMTGREPVLAGSGSTWYVEGEPVALGLDDRTTLELGGRSATLVAARTVPPGWEGSGAA